MVVDKSPISLIDSGFGEEKAQSCVTPWLQQSPVFNRRRSWKLVGSFFAVKVALKTHNFTIPVLPQAQPTLAACNRFFSLQSSAHSGSRFEPPLSVYPLPERECSKSSFDLRPFVPFGADTPYKLRGSRLWPDPDVLQSAKLPPSGRAVPRSR